VRMTRCVSIALVLVMLSLGRGVVRAQEAGPAPATSPTDVQEAREAFQVAVSLYAAGRYAEAAREFERSYSLSHEGGLLRNLYLARRDAGDVPGAAEALRAYLAAGAPDTTEDDRRMLEHRLAALDRAIEEEAAAARAREEAARATAAAETERRADTSDAHDDAASGHAASAEEAALEASLVVPEDAGGDVTEEAWFWALLGGGVLVVGGAVAIGLALTTPGPGMDGDVLGRIETLTWSVR
jgi:hypothetical protein